MSTSSQSPTKRARKGSSSLSVNTPSKPAPVSTRVSQIAHPHPLRQTSFPRDFSSDDRIDDDEESADQYLGPPPRGDVPDRGQEDDEAIEDDDFDVTRQAIRRGGHDEDDEDDEDDDGGLFNFSSVALKSDNSQRSTSTSKRPRDADEYDAGLATKTSATAGTVNDSFGDLFPDAAQFGIDIDEAELSNMAEELPDNLPDIANIVSINQETNQLHKRRRIFGPGMSQEQIKTLISSFTDDQMDRYETFRRANISRGGVKKLANAVLNQSITNNVAVAISGFSKVFMGEVIERALDVQRRMDPPDPLNPYDTPMPLLPEHIREAWRLYKQETALVPAAHWRRAGGQGDGRMFR
ncbi:hTAFII28-like protein conserved region-domain-containing protein [Lipomyces kononenkoae]|uniref:HTAFII28-like protein conserved region-domain-containing protein n=1 Tax=Lipomyces kononenkoae TaxID=34357 RepID=A0ACC3TBC6_LIPKO